MREFAERDKKGNKYGTIAWFRQKQKNKAYANELKAEANLGAVQKK